MTLVEDAKKFGRPSVWLLDEIRCNVLGNKGRSEEEIKEAVIYAYKNIKNETGIELFDFIKDNKDYEIVIDYCKEIISKYTEDNKIISKFLEEIDTKHADKIKNYLKVENGCVYIVNGEDKYEVANYNSGLTHITSEINGVIDGFYNKLLKI